MTTWADLGIEPKHEDIRAWCDRLSDRIEEWQGVPIPLGEELPLVLEPKHTLKPFFAELRSAGMTEIDIMVTAGDVPDDEEIVNHWYCRKRQVDVYVACSQGKYYAVTIPNSPDRSMDRLTYWLTTIGASDAWDLDAENRARITLRAMVTDRQWRHYDLTGCFFETSPRSRLTYVFRRLRPTLAMTPRWPWWNRHQPDTMKCLAVLCMHPIGYYAKSWGGCMVPTDDVIAHLSWMRGDEAGYWGVANQHEPSAPEAGL